MYSNKACITEIRSDSCPDCFFCGARGTFLYKKLVDRIFGAPGEWNFKKCLNAECGAIWLDPQPRADDIVKAYRHYYTHNAPDSVNKTAQRPFYHFLKKKYWAQRYGYVDGSLPFRDKIIGLAIALNPLRKAALDSDVMYLPVKYNGKLLDLGCGNGKRLELMRDLGWLVEGIDFDENAVRSAQRKGLQVHCGTLHEIHYPEDHFDAIMMSHVFEHIYEPIELLRECYRILKPNGYLVIVTPNNESLSHRVFKRNWRGLEPPRHLHIMSMKSLRRAVLDVGFRINSIRSYVLSSYVYRSSYALSKNIQFDNGKASLNFIQSKILGLFAFVNSLISLLHRNLGDNLVVIAIK